MRSSKHLYSFSLQVQVPNINSDLQQSRTICLNVCWTRATIDGLVRKGRLLTISTTVTGAVVVSKATNCRQVQDGRPVAQPALQGTKLNCVHCATGWAVAGSIPGRGKHFFYISVRPERLWGPPSLLFNGYLGSFLG